MEDPEKLRAESLSHFPHMLTVVVFIVHETVPLVHVGKISEDFVDWPSLDYTFMYLKGQSPMKQIDAFLEECLWKWARNILVAFLRRGKSYIQRVDNKSHSSKFYSSKQMSVIIRSQALDSRYNCMFLIYSSQNIELPKDGGSDQRGISYLHFCRLFCRLIQRPCHIMIGKWETLYYNKHK